MTRIVTKSGCEIRPLAEDEGKEVSKFLTAIGRCLLACESVDESQPKEDLAQNDREVKP